MRFAADPALRWGAAAAVPALWLAVAWVDIRFVLLAAACALAAWALVRRRERGRDPDDELIL